MITNDNYLKYSKYIGKVVRHFKGNYYYIENIGMDSETHEYVIIYRALYERNDSYYWVRPAEMFFEDIDQNRKDNITKQKKRFEIVSDFNVNYIKNK